MDKELYLRELYKIHTDFKNLKKEFLEKWPSGPPPYKSPENEKWYKDFLTIIHRYPSISFGFLYAEGARDFFGRKPIWIDPAFEYKKRIEECIDEQERDEIVFKFRREWGRLMFESVKIAIPIYPDTTKEDIDKLWSRIEALKTEVYDEVPRPKRKKFRENIELYKFGMTQEECLELTGKPGNPWTMEAERLNITPQACRERFEGIKRFLSLHLGENVSGGTPLEAKQSTSDELDCETCSERNQCKLIRTGRGSCLIFERTWKSEISSQNYISIDSIEKKNARYQGHWQDEDELINSLSGGSEE